MAELELERQSERQYVSPGTVPERESRGFSRSRRAQPKGNLEQSLGWFSLGLGLAEVVAPRRLGRLIGLPGHSGLLRAYGARELAAGAGILAQRQPARWMFARVVGDAMDLATLGVAALSRRSNRKRVGIAAAAVGGVTALDIVSAKRLARSSARESIIRREKSISVNRSPEECYRFWRDFKNLARIMDHVEGIEVTSPRRSHWVALGPAGVRVEWDAEITTDNENRSIAWRSLEGADVDNFGVVRFEPRPGNRGTIIRADIQYRSPGGKLGSAIASLFGHEPGQQVAGALRRFKQLIETGEIATTEGQPSGRCERRATQ